MEKIERKIDALKTVKARAEYHPVEARRGLLVPRDLMPHPLDGLRLRIDAGEDLDAALNAELDAAYSELSRLAAEIKRRADADRDAMKAGCMAAGTARDSAAVHVFGRVG